MGHLNGKAAIITGGGSGIGLAAARLFLQEGAQVVIAGRDADKLIQAAKGLSGGDRLLTLACDVSQPDQVKKLVEQTLAKFGKIDILVNNAGTNVKERTFRQLTPEVWQKLIRINLDGAFYCTHAVMPDMMARKDGIIINVSSTAGKRANPLGGIAYAAAKFGVAALGIGLAEEEKNSGVRVCNIYPGEVDTPILEFRPSPVNQEHRQRILKPEDVAAAILFAAIQPPHVSIPELVIKPTSQSYI